MTRGCQSPRRRLTSMGAESNLKSKNITLPAPPSPMANYVTAVRVGNLLFLAGHGPVRGSDGKMARGKVGKDLSTEQGAQVAREVRSEERRVGKEGRAGLS